MTDFTRTRRALQRYDEGLPNRQRLWAAVYNARTLADAERADRRAEDLVRVAFALDTAAFNPPDRAALIHPDDPEFRAIVLGPLIPGT